MHPQCTRHQQQSQTTTMARILPQPTISYYLHAGNKNRRIKFHKTPISQPLLQSLHIQLQYRYKKNKRKQPWHSNCTTSTTATLYT